MVFLARARSDMRARSAAVLICSAEIFCPSCRARQPDVKCVRVDLRAAFSGWRVEATLSRRAVAEMHVAAPEQCALVRGSSDPHALVELFIQPSPPPCPLLESRHRRDVTMTPTTAPHPLT